MPWAALDDGFHEDPRTLESGLAAAGLYACATCYVARHLLDGIIPRTALMRMVDGDPGPLDALLRVGYLRDVDGGYMLEGYLDGNQTRAVVEQRRADAKARKTRWSEGQAKKRRASRSDAWTDDA